MKSYEHVIYIGGVGDKPEVQQNLEELWLPHGLLVEHQPIDWADTDYMQRLKSIGERAVQLSKLGNVSLVGASGGGKAVLSLFARHSDYIHRSVTISAKVQPYITSAATREAYPNLAISSDTLQEDLPSISNEMRRRILCVYPLSDEVVAPEDAVLEGALEYSVHANGHINGIDVALTSGGGTIADFVFRE